MNRPIINKLIPAAFCALVLLAGAEANAQRRTGKNVSPKTQTARVEIVAGGYQPEELRLKRGILARVTFIRKTQDECGEEVLFPDYNIRRKLPFNQPVTIAFTPRRAGSFAFACGMDMMRGKLIVQ